MANEGRLTDKDFYEQACAYFSYHAEQRSAMINYFIAVFGASIALYGTLLEKYTLASVMIGIFAGIVSVLFYLIDVRNRFDVKMSQSVICQIEHNYGMDKPNGKYSYGVFNNEDNNFKYYDLAARKDPAYREIRKAYKKAKNKKNLPDELRAKIKAVTDNDPYISEEAFTDSLRKGTIVHLTTCIQWLYIVCMIISALAVILAIFICLGLF